MKTLSKDGKEELALALILWKDFKSECRLDIEIFKQMMEFAEYLGVTAELDGLLSKVPPLEIKPRQY